jgi:hypothetical protein
MTGLRHLPRAFIPPLILLLLAVVIGLAAIVVPEPPTQVASTPLDLRRDGVVTKEFRAVRDEFYGLKVEMDQAAAKRLFPCTVDFDRWDDPTCAKEVMPIELSIVLYADGAEILRKVYSAQGVHGGEYGGDETFALSFEGLHLERGRSYRLVVRSLANASPLAATRPRVVVEADTVDRMGDVVLRVLALAVALGLGIIAGLWAGVIQILRSRAARRLQVPA